MPRYLLNSAVIPSGTYGTFTYAPASVADLQAFLAAGPVDSRLGYEGTIEQIARWTGVRLPLNTDPNPMVPGDEAFVVRLAYRARYVHGRKGLLQAPPEAWELGRLTYVRASEGGDLNAAP